MTAGRRRIKYETHSLCIISRSAVQDVFVLNRRVGLNRLRNRGGIDFGEHDDHTGFDAEGALSICFDDCFFALSAALNAD
jgi:hypothetical protein